MFKIKYIRQNAEFFDRCMEMRGSTIRAADIIAAHSEYAAQVNNRADLTARSNELGKLIAKDPSNASLREEASAIKAQIKLIDPEAVDKIFNDLVASTPNILHDVVIPGLDESHNKVLRYWGEKPQIENPREHDEIASSLLDKRAGTISGTRYSVLRGDLAQLERAIGQFMIDLHTREHEFEEVSVPSIVKPEALFGTGQLPKFKDDLFSVGDKYLIPTAEVPLTALYMDRLDRKPVNSRMTALTPCYRSEAGSSGKDTKGLIRQHQFQKVEMVSVVDQKSSLHEFYRVVGFAERVLRDLGLHYREVLLCAGDTGFSSMLTHDLEVWLPGQDTYREISSISLCGEFQATRLNARYYDSNGDTKFYHTINGSGLAVGRTLVAILENYLNPDGSVRIPEKLQPYMGGKTEILKG